MTSDGRQSCRFSSSVNVQLLSTIQSGFSRSRRAAAPLPTSHQQDWSDGEESSFSASDSDDFVVAPTRRKTRPAAATTTRCSKSTPDTTGTTATQSHRGRRHGTPPLGADPAEQQELQRALELSKLEFLSRHPTTAKVKEEPKEEPLEEPKEEMLKPKQTSLKLKIPSSSAVTTTIATADDKENQGNADRDLLESGPEQEDSILPSRASRVAAHSKAKPAPFVQVAEEEEEELEDEEEEDEDEEEDAFEPSEDDDSSELEEPGDSDSDSDDFRPAPKKQKPVTGKAATKKAPTITRKAPTTTKKAPTTTKKAATTTTKKTTIQATSNKTLPAKPISSLPKLQKVRPKLLVVPSADKKPLAAVPKPATSTTTATLIDSSIPRVRAGLSKQGRVKPLHPHLHANLQRSS